MEQQEVAIEESGADNYQIHPQKAKRVVIFIDNPDNTNTNEKEIDNSNEVEEVTLIRYSQQLNFH